MKKNILKIIGLLALTMLIALNVTSTMEFAPGGQQVEAKMQVDEIPCWSAYGTGEFGDNFVYCLGCKNKSGRERNTSGTCTPQD